MSEKMSGIPPELPSVGGDFGVPLPSVKIKEIGVLGPDDQVWIKISPVRTPSKEIEDMEIAALNLVWWIGLVGTLCFAMGIACLLVAHILGRP